MDGSQGTMQTEEHTRAVRAEWSQVREGDVDLARRSAAGDRAA